MSNLDGLDKRMVKALLIINKYMHPVVRELPKRIYDNGVLIYETPLERAYPGAVYKEYLSDPGDDGTEP